MACRGGPQYLGTVRIQLDLPLSIPTSDGLAGWGRGTLYYSLLGACKSHIWHDSRRHSMFPELSASSLSLLISRHQKLSPTEPIPGASTLPRDKVCLLAIAETGPSPTAADLQTKGPDHPISWRTLATRIQVTGTNGARSVVYTPAHIAPRWWSHQLGRIMRNILHGGLMFDISSLLSDRQ